MIKIMLVDDSPVFISLVSKIIDTDVTFKTIVSAFSDGWAAKEQFLKLEPDLVITDIEMRHFDGLQLIEYIKSQGNTPTLTMSGSTLENNSTDTLLYCAKAMGSDYIILKDEISENISQLITEIIKKHCI